MANLISDRALTLSYGTEKRTVRLYDSKPVASYVGAYTGATAATYPTGTIIRNNGAKMYYHLDPFQTPRSTGHFMYHNDDTPWSVHSEYNPERMDLTNNIYWDFYDHYFAYGGGISEITSVEKKFGTTSYLMTNKGLIWNAADLPVGNSSSQWTMEYWCKIPSYSAVPEQFPAYFCIIDNTTGDILTTSAYSGYWTGTNTTGNFSINTSWSTASPSPVILWFCGNANGGTYDFSLIPSTFHTDTWIHIAAVKNGGTLTLYRNGTAIASSTKVPGNNFSNFVLGYGVNGINTGVPCLPSPSYYDEVRVSNCARYTSDFTPPTSAFTPDSNTVILMHFEI